MNEKPTKQKAPNVPRREQNWEMRYHELALYVDGHGHANVPARYEPNHSLGTWVMGQRKAHQNQQMTPERFGLLERLGFNFDGRHGNVWDVRCKELEAYVEEHGNADVPYKYQNSKLGEWVSRQRKVHKKNKLSQECVERLQILGFNFVIGRGNNQTKGHVDLWDKRFSALEEYVKDHGHANVPENHTPEALRKWATKQRSLGRWVTAQRSNHKFGKLSTDRFNQLRALNFDFNDQRGRNASIVQKQLVIGDVGEFAGEHAGEHDPFVEHQEQVVGI